MWQFVEVKSHDSLSRTVLPGTLGGWGGAWSTEEMLERQRHRMDLLARPRTAHGGSLPHERLEEDLC